MQDVGPPPASSNPRFLICRPQHFAVTYSINPWMDPKAWAGSGAVLHAQAVQQWDGLHRTLRACGAAIETVEPQPGLPDLVFTANAAVVLNRKALLTRFLHPQRQREEPVFAAAFRALAARGLLDDVVELPPGVTLEGAGDCLWDRSRKLFWIGSGFRSNTAARDAVEREFGVPCLPLALADPNFYHLDTAFCALPSGDVLYYPAAFTPAALDTIHEHVAPAQRIALGRADALRFAANAVCVGGSVVMSSCSDTLKKTLAARGYSVARTPLQAFLRSGGSACCLTLRLDLATGAAQASINKSSVKKRGKMSSMTAA
jgi:N-dimethylarginine dimethylaminohydrolase